MIAGDGRQIPEGARFDRVLVDAPCSGEGNYRRRAGQLPGRTSGFSSYVTALQESLLRRAIELTRPGGVIVYSTCTYAPEENEEVLDRVLRDAPATLEPISLGAPHAPGLTEWRGRRFSAALAHAWRVYPHHLDSGGLFMARLRRDDRAGREDGGGWTPIPEAFFGESKSRAGKRIATAVHELEDWFGLSPAILGRLGWMVRGKHIWSHTAERWPVTEWLDRRGTGSWRVVSVGLRALRSGPGSFETPSSHFLTRWGSQIGDRRKLDLDRDALAALLRGDELPTAVSRGPVALVWNGMVLGRGVVGAKGLRHELGRPYAQRLQELIEAAAGIE